MMKKEIINEQINRGDTKSLHIGSVIVKSILNSDKKIMIPTLEYSKIKENILESFIEGKIGNPS
ncbi:MAG: hypothetical protein ACW98X_15880 [Promethearchaeota archaeon]|jgi:hypothetical protein